MITNLESNCDIFDIINHVERYGDKDIDIFMLDGEPWFRGNDIAKILGYVHPSQAIRDLIDADDKQSMQALIQKVQVKNLDPKINQNQLKSAYINESGLYTLIMSSKLEQAKKFRKWVTGTLLPTIRRSGHKKIMKQLSETQRELEDIRKKTLVLSEFQDRTKPRIKKEIFYIATTRQYAQNCRFKFGGVENVKKMTSRLANYNSDRAAEDKFYFAFMTEVYNFRTLENRLKDIIPAQFKDDKTSKNEMIHCHFDALKKIIEFLIENHSDEVEFMNGFIKEMVQMTIEKEPTIPEPIIMNMLEVRLVKNGKEETKFIDLDTLEEKERIEIVRRIFENFYPGKKEITRTEFENYAKQQNLRFKSRPMWKLLKDISANLITVKY